MKYLPLMLLVLLFSLQWPTSCVSQHKKIQPVALIANDEIFRTTDSVHYFRADNNQPMNGTYDIYLTEMLPFSRDSVHETDVQYPPIRAISNRHTIGTFTNGLKTGVWVYYRDKQRIKEETYRAGRPVSTRKCPCPK